MTSPRGWKGSSAERPRPAGEEARRAGLGGRAGERRGQAFGVEALFRMDVPGLFGFA